MLGGLFALCVVVVPAAETPVVPASPAAPLSIIAPAPAPGVPRVRPADADPLELDIRWGEESASGRVAMMVRASQIVRLTAVAAAPASGRVIPPLANTPEGKGPGAAELSTTEEVAWEWPAGMGLDFQGTTLIWRAPEQGGFYEVRCRMLQTRVLRGADGGHPVRLAHAWGERTVPVLIGEEYDARQLTIQGVAIGLYPDQNNAAVPAAVAQNREAYTPPRYLYKVTPETARLPVSEHFTLGDFAMELGRFGDRQFIALDPALPARLETLQTEVARKFPGARLRVLRGSLTPLAAESLRREGGKISEFSRFLYGDAAIVIVDGNGDGIMDDLTGDGIANLEDAKALAAMTEEIERRSGLAGGIGTYAKTDDPSLPGNTPFVHVDTRGRLARWEVAE